MSNISKIVDTLRNMLRVSPKQNIGLHGHYKLRAYNRDGSIKWEDSFDNLVVNNGLDHVLEVALRLGTQAGGWYVGIKATGTPAAADTMVSHGSWSEITAYSQSNRPTWSPGSLSSQSVDNAASPAQFTINANGTVIYGAFLTSINTKGGNTGTLFSAGNFISSKTLDSGEILEITITYTISSS